MAGRSKKGSDSVPPKFLKEEASSAGNPPGQDTSARYRDKEQEQAAATAKKSKKKKETQTEEQQAPAAASAAPEEEMVYVTEEEYNHIQAQLAKIRKFKELTKQVATLKPKRKAAKKEAQQGELALEETQPQEPPAKMKWKRGFNPYAMVKNIMRQMAQAVMQRFNARDRMMLSQVGSILQAAGVEFKYEPRIEIGTLSTPVLSFDRQISEKARDQNFKEGKISDDKASIKDPAKGHVGKLEAQEPLFKKKDAGGIY